MKTDIPYIECESDSFKLKGIDIIRIEDLAERNENSNSILEVPHILDFYAFVFYTDGVSEHLVDFVWHKVQKKTLVYLTEGQINAFKFNINLKGFVILFNKEYLNKQLNKIPKEAMVCLFTPHLFASTFKIPEALNIEKYIKSLYEEYNSGTDDSSKHYIIDSLYSIIFAKIEQLKKHNVLFPNESDKLSLFLKFKNILEIEFTNSRNADYYAEKLNTTYQHLNAVCKEIVQLSTKQFIDDFVILEAKRKLINSSIKSSELAFIMGFDESTNFVKYFKKHTKLTPNQFKKRHIK